MSRAAGGLHLVDDRQGRLTLELASATFLVTGVIVLVTSRGRHLAWPVFLLIAVAAVLPAWR